MNARAAIADEPAALPPNTVWLLLGGFLGAVLLNAHHTALWCLPLAVAQACILIAAVADSAASIIGARWGRTFWSHNRLKSLEGSTAFLVSAIVCGSVYLPLRSAVPLAIVAALIESLPLQDWDNFVMPVGAGLIGVTLMGIG